MTTASGRLAYYDFLRGIAILMVVAIHAYIPGGFDTLAGEAALFFRQLLSCAVPVFLAISGFFLAGKPLDTWSERRTFWRRHIVGVYVPCLVWSVPSLFLGLAAAGTCTLPVVLKWLLIFFACGCGVSYFVALIIQCYFLLPWLKRGKTASLLGFGLMSCVAVLAVSWYLYVEGQDLPDLLAAGPFPVYGFFFVLGVWLSHRPRTYRFVPLCLLLLPALWWMYVETQWFMSFPGKGVGIKLSAFLYAALVILILFSRRLQDVYAGRGFIFRVVQWVGSVSFGVYLVHIHAISLVVNLFGLDGWLAKWMGATLLTLAFIAAVKRVMPRFSAKWLGFR